MLATRNPFVSSLTNRVMHLCKRNGVADLKHAPTHLLPCRIWSFWVKRCRHKYTEPQKLGSSGAPPPCGRAWLTSLEIYHSPSRVILPNLVVLGQAVRALLRRSPEKIDHSRPGFQGHSKSSELTRIDPSPMTS